MKLAVLVLAALVGAAMAADFHGTWSSDNRYGGPTYMCPVGDRVYGVYSNGGFFVGELDGRNLEGIYFEGGRGDRNYLQGSFKITLSRDNLEFDGFYNRVSDPDPQRWHESRLGAPWPSNPTPTQCMVPGNKRVQGRYTSFQPGYPPGKAMICWDQATSQVYGSAVSQDAYFDGWSVDDNTGFQGYIYTGDGKSGACILRAVSDEQTVGWFWRGHLRRGNFGTSQPITMTRIGDGVSRSECQEYGPGFARRFKGPGVTTVSAATTASVSGLAMLFAVIAAVVLAF